MCVCVFAGLPLGGLSVCGRQYLEIQGPRLNQTKEEKTSVNHGQDHRLDPIIAPPMPLLEVCVRVRVRVPDMSIYLEDLVGQGCANVMRSCLTCGLATFN